MRAAATSIITFGLVSIPVKLYVAASDESVSFNMLNAKTGNRVKQKLVDSVTGDELTQADTVKGYEYAKNQYVRFTPEELKALEPATSKTIDVQEFVPADSIESVAIESWYYLGPDKGGDKGYTLLAETMRVEEVVAVAQWSVRNKEHLVTIAPYGDGLALRVMFYAEEVRPFAEVLDGLAKLTISEAERNLAVQLVQQLTSETFEAAKYTDAYAARVRQAADQKAAGGQITLPPSPASATIIDMVEALKRSLSDQKAAPGPKKTKPRAAAKKKGATG